MEFETICTRSSVYKETHLVPLNLEPFSLYKPLPSRIQILRCPRRSFNATWVLRRPICRAVKAGSVVEEENRLEERKGGEKRGVELEIQISRRRSLSPGKDWVNPKRLYLNRVGRGLFPPVWAFPFLKLVSEVGLGQKGEDTYLIYKRKRVTEASLHFEIISPQNSFTTTIK
jgi:hypothetical protein